MFVLGGGRIDEVGGYEGEEESKPEKDVKLERLENRVWVVA